MPIRSINFSDLTDKARHDKMVLLVNQMLDLHKRKSLAKDAADQERLQRMIESPTNRSTRLCMSYMD